MFPQCSDAVEEERMRLLNMSHNLSEEIAMIRRKRMMLRQNVIGDVHSNMVQ